MWEKAIIHSRIDDYFAQVEELMFPHLKNEVLVVAEDGIVLSGNNLAKDFYIYEGDTVESAYKKCSKLKVVCPHYTDYHYYHELIKNIYREYSDKVESDKGYENWVDLTMSQGIYGGHPVDIAKDIQIRIYKEVGIEVSLGVSFNKLFAKLVNNSQNKSNFNVCMRRYFKKDVYPLCLQETPYLTLDDIEILNQNGIYTVGGIAYKSCEMLEMLLGRKGTFLWELTQGENVNEDVYSVFDKNVSMIGENIICYQPVSTYEETINVLKTSIMDIACYLEDYSLKGKVISLRLRNQANQDITLEKRVAISTRNIETINDVVEMLVRENCVNHWNGKFQNAYQSMSLIISQISYDCDEDNTFEYNKSFMNLLIPFGGMKQKLGLKRSLG